MEKISRSVKRPEIVEPQWLEDKKYPSLVVPNLWSCLVHIHLRLSCYFLFSPLTCRKLPSWLVNIFAGDAGIHNQCIEYQKYVHFHLGKLYRPQPTSLLLRFSRKPSLSKKASILVGEWLYILFALIPSLLRIPVGSFVVSFGWSGGAKNGVSRFGGVRGFWKPPGWAWCGAFLEAWCHGLVKANWLNSVLLVWDFIQGIKDKVRSFLAWNSTIHEIGICRISVVSTRISWFQLQVRSTFEAATGYGYCRNTEPWGTPSYMEISIWKKPETYGFENFFFPIFFPYFGRFQGMYLIKQQDGTDQRILGESTFRRSKSYPIRGGLRLWFVAKKSVDCSLKKKLSNETTNSGCLGYIGGLYYPVI